MTDLEMLREAARLMRERANAATPGPWSVELVGEGRAWVNLPGCPHGWGMHGFPAEAEHVASWHPVVALAVADWLDAEADLHYGAAVAEVAVRHVTEGQWEVRLTGSTLPQALAVARAYLRREP